MGDTQARQIDSQQPMKMAAAEALYNTQDGASFSLLTIGDLTGNPIFQIRIPHLLSLIADNSWNGQVKGIKQLQAADVKKFGPGNYVPILWITYWSFRLMVGLGLLMIALGGVGLWLVRKRRLEKSAWFLRFQPDASRTLPRQQPGLDIHRRGAPALGRVRTPQDKSGGVPRLGRLRRHQSRRFHGDLHVPRGPRNRPDGQGRAQSTSRVVRAR